MAARFAALLCCLTLGDAPDLAAGQAPVAGGTSLEVPYLPQTEALCGGAAAAMLLRYWGDRHASVQQFAPLVDHQAGGIADTALTEALRDRHWSAVRLEGSVATLRAELAAGRPPMLLLEDRPLRYHYVVAVGIDEQGLSIHDPTWGPSRRLSFGDLRAAWGPSGFWTLRVTPGDAHSAAGAAPAPGSPVGTQPKIQERRNATTQHGNNASTQASTTEPRTRSSCDERFDAALDEIQAHGLSRAEEVLTAVAARCPADARPLRELAGVRFTQRQWNDASALATAALALSPDDPYAADVLGSSRFMLNDIDGALRGWNVAARPVLDSVRITGLSRTRYSLLTQALDLPADSLLTADAFTRARRRLESMPDLASTRLSLRPGDDGYAVADVAVVERATLPRSRVQWIAASSQAALEREVAALIPGRTGQGETWTAAWGWWENRPKASVEFAAPLVTHPRGVWRVALSWEAQTYGFAPTAIREERLFGDLGFSSWISANVRVDLSAGLDAWSRPHAETHRTWHVGGAVERRLFDDRVGARVSLARWDGISGGSGFGVASAELSYHSRPDPGPLVAVARMGGSTATGDAPLALWNGAGEGRGRAPLLRAHPLLHDGRIDGPVFGRRLAHGTVEVQHWFPEPSLLRIGAAVFSDAAIASQREAFAVGRPFQWDAGAGLRVRVPGRAGLFRVDYAHGLRDGADAWMVAWQRGE